MARVFADIKQEIRALGRALLEELEALPDATRPSVLRAAIEIDLAAANHYVAQHGSFAESAREHYAAGDNAV